MIIAYYCYRGIAEERQSSSGDVSNSFTARLSRAFGSVCPNVREKLGGWLGPSPVTQGSYLDVDESINSHKVIFKKIVRRGTMAPYEFKFNDPAHVITGIACGPQDEKTSTPDVDVVDGGIGFHRVVIRLSPVQKGPWACSIEISGTEEDSVHMT